MSIQNYLKSNFAKQTHKSNLPGKHFSGVRVAYKTAPVIYKIPININQNNDASFKRYEIPSVISMSKAGTTPENNNIKTLELIGMLKNCIHI